LLPQLKLGGFELQYARGGQIRELLAEAFPQYAHLKAKKKQETASKFEVFRANMAVADPGFEDKVEEEVQKLEPVASTSIKEAFEDALIKAVHEGASDICIIPSVGGETEVYFQIGDDLKPWTLASGFASDSLITMVCTEVLRVKRSKKGEIQKRDVQRWIDGERVNFRVILLPPSEKMHMESIVIRLNPLD